MTCTDPLGHLVSTLQANSAAELPEVAAILKRLEPIRDDIAAVNATADITRQDRPRAAGSPRSSGRGPPNWPAPG